MKLGSSDRVLANANITVFWEGFSASLHSLWQSGWRFDLEESPYATTLAISRDKVIGRADLGDGLYRLKEFQYLPLNTVVNIRFYSDIRIISRSEPSFARMELVSTPDQDVQHVHTTEYSLLHILQEAEDSPEEIIVDPPTVSELLEEIKRMQAPRARELLRRENSLEKRVTAKIITFG